MNAARGTLLRYWRQVRKRLSFSGGAELGGMAVFVAGVWMVWEPAAVMLAGIAAVLWSQGRKQ